MASDSPGNYGKSPEVGESLDCQAITDLLRDSGCARGNFQVSGSAGYHRDASMTVKDSGYYVSTSDGASTCSSSTTETGEVEAGTLLVLEPKSLRSFTTNDEYIYAMKEDLADWFACLYQRDDINADNFFQVLETGVLLCRHANKVQEYARQRREMGDSLEMRSYFIRSVPEGNVGYREGVKPETFQARDNVSNFISWGRQLGIPEVLSFETDDLVLRKNERSVILCLLEIARVGAKLGMLAPTLILMEQEIDAELAGEEPKPQIQIITCDMRSLDERVRDLIGRCTCPVQFPMIKVGEGKYKIGDSRSLIFVRILRNHVMVRVGGGWDTLENYLNKHDPCQCHYRGHRPSNAGSAHKVSVNQQRQPATPGGSVCRTTPNTPTSPRRASQPAADRHRSTSPQNSGIKAPTLIISRHNPIACKKPADPGMGGHSLAGPSVGVEDSWQTPSGLSSQQAAGNSTSPARRRSVSPQTLSSSSGSCLPKSLHQASPNTGQVKGKDVGHEHKNHMQFKNKNKTVDRSGSLDDKGHVHSTKACCEHLTESDATYSGDAAEKSIINMDRINTMTLAEFKSMLSSSLSAPEIQQPELQAGRSAAESSGMSSGAARVRNWNVQNQKPDSAPAPHSTDESFSTDISQPKTPTSASRSHLFKPSADAVKEEYKMARPKPASQIKRDAVAKVAGAISNWVESRNDVDSIAPALLRPKTPTRPKTLVGAHSSFSQGLLHEDDEDDEIETADTVSSSLTQSMTQASRERPVTPSRIPKPCFIPRPKTPSSFTAESPGAASSQLMFASQAAVPILTKLSLAGVSRPVALSRSNSNSSSVKSMDEAPVSPSSSLSEDRILKVHSRARRLSNSSETCHAINSTSNISCSNTSGRSYKDIYVAKKAATSCSDGRAPLTRAVTPGPREKWTLGGSNGSVLVSESLHPASNTQRRPSINTKVEGQQLIKPSAVASPVRQISGLPHDDLDCSMAITNEITFSDDEEINEIIKNAAVKVTKKPNVRSSSVGARKYAKQHEEEVLMICRDENMKGNVSGKFSLVRRPSSRASSNGRASPVTVVSRLSHTTSPSVRQNKIQSVVKNKETEGRGSPVLAVQSVHKNMKRTEAWVDTTLTDNKKPLPPLKQMSTNTSETRDLASRPLEEIQAILSEPTNGFVHVDTRGLDAPPEDPAMFRKMEKLFEKYREMELKASMNESLSAGSFRTTTPDKVADTLSTKSEGHRFAHGAWKLTTSATSSKVSSGSVTCHSSGHASNALVSSRTPSAEVNKLMKSSGAPRPFQNIQHQAAPCSSPLCGDSERESKQRFDVDRSHQITKPRTPDPPSDHKGLGVLQDIDPELAKNPAALISKIKEILKVRPRKDENTKGATRIPAPATLNRRTRSKSVSNLYSDCLLDAGAGSNCDDFDGSESDSTGALHNVESHLCSVDDRACRQSSHRGTDSNIDTSVKASDCADEVASLISVSGHYVISSDDCQNRSETPVPKLATPLTTGRSTLFSRRGDKLSRTLSHDKENVSTSQPTITGLSVMTPTEDQVDFV